METNHVAAPAQSGASVPPKDTHGSETGQGIILELEPDTVRLGPIDVAMVDDLVDRKVARTAGLIAHTARREILSRVIRLGLRELVREEGIG